MLLSPAVCTSWVSVVSLDFSLCYVVDWCCKRIWVSFIIITLHKFQDNLISSNALNYHFKLRHACLCSIQISAPVIVNHLHSIVPLIRSSKASSEIYIFILLSSKEFLIVLPLSYPTALWKKCMFLSEVCKFWYIFPYLKLLPYIVHFLPSSISPHFHPISSVFLCEIMFTYQDHLSS